MIGDQQGQVDLKDLMDPLAQLDLLDQVVKGVIKANKEIQALLGPQVPLDKLGREAQLALQVQLDPVDRKVKLDQKDQLGALVREDHRVKLDQLDQQDLQETVVPRVQLALKVTKVIEDPQEKQVLQAQQVKLDRLVSQVLLEL